MVMAARFHGVELDPFSTLAPRDGSSPAALVAWARDNGLWARAARLRWRHLIAEPVHGPAVLLLKDGSAALLLGASPSGEAVFLRDPAAPEGSRPTPVDEARLAALWDGTAVLLRRGQADRKGEPPFNFGWLLRLVLQQRALIRGTVVAALVLGLLGLAAPLMVMATLNRVLQQEGLATLTMIVVLFLVVVLYEVALTYARHNLLLTLSARIDVRLNLYVLERLLRLPLDYFERNPAGDVTHRLGQVWRVRDFITGRIGAAVLDSAVLIFALPVLFILNSTLAALVCVAAALLGILTLIFVPALRRVSAEAMKAETRKNAFMVETVHGIRTIKALAMEPHRRAEWDVRVADVTEGRLRAGRLAVWPTLLALPLEQLMSRGLFLLGAYLVILNPQSMAMGSLVAFMMLSMRVAGPFVSFSRMLTDIEEVRAAVQQSAEVLNAPPETPSGVLGARPRLTGAISLQDVSYTYPGAAMPALQDFNLKIEPGTVLGVVGRSGSGKSTLVRLLQGITRGYSGLIRFDDVELREIDLAHLRRSTGVVLQDSFLFRGTIRENILAGRPHVTIEDAVRAARLAGAEEFIERLPAGYNTMIEEGATNLSGGQRQRLSIARALINDPRLLILDEATSALDPESEALVSAGLRRMALGRTLVIVSHRLASLVNCDAILVIDKGGVEAIGTHEELLERSMTYRKLWMQQGAKR
ncbi:peptidase domain-containing ABC transporter [Falsiroseomonas sp. HC035]|uniref:peptidase domain-containing ABC transporter n=1 Tax=Falsiroseomonas sp. HC035 TaxID=3390999 RepID=UPI003D31F094